MLDNSAQIVDALRIRLAVNSDSAVAAGLLGVDPGPLVLACLAETERRPGLAALYRQLADRLGRGTRRTKRVAAVLGASR